MVYLRCLYQYFSDSPLRAIPDADHSKNHFSLVQHEAAASDWEMKPRKLLRLDELG